MGQRGQVRRVVRHIRRRRRRSSWRVLLRHRGGRRRRVRVLLRRVLRRCVLGRDGGRAAWGCMDGRGRLVGSRAILWRSRGASSRKGGDAVTTARGRGRGRQRRSGRARSSSGRCGDGRVMLPVRVFVVLIHQEAENAGTQQQQGYKDREND